MGTARVEQEEEADTRIIVKEYEICQEKILGTKRGKRPKQDLTAELPEGREFHLQ